MPKNVLIFCDGTGQAGGIRFDEARTNVYKMYRAMRCGPDTTVNPTGQVAFYDPGLGSTADGGHLVGRILRSIYNVVAQATGFGITRNIIDCYAAVIRLWRPGDRIYLFGFSRGAYTARCVAEVISLCGIPSQAEDGTPLKLDSRSVRNIASFAVKHIYQFTAPRPNPSARQKLLERTRLELASTFQSDHETRHGEQANDRAHFVGVFDTVAALVNPAELAALVAAVLAMIAAIAGSVALFASPYGERSNTFVLSFAWIALISFVAASLGYIWTHFKFDYARGIKRMIESAHFTDCYPRFYDDGLDPNIGYAKHAISLDESRKAFAHEKWIPTIGRHTSDDEQGTPWFEQVWFAGNHADIGGGYPEADSRLSDIALDWMVRCACEVPGGLQFDGSVLRRWPSPEGLQHNEVEAGGVRIAKFIRLTWPKQNRRLPRQGKIIMHETVYDRFEAGAVAHWDGMRSYLSAPLSDYPDVKVFYAAKTQPGQKADRKSQARRPKEAR